MEHEEALEHRPEVLWIEDIRNITGKHDRTIARWVQDKRFPPPRKFASNRNAWLKSDIQAWLRTFEESGHAA